MAYTKNASDSIYRSKESAKFSKFRYFKKWRHFLTRRNVIVSILSKKLRFLQRKTKKDPVDILAL